ncbi:cytochrome d ubiquinol oxidase subunit II [Neobacillus sp. OS1-32]|jgi:cytochrome d ubiquinol oxidase subunit II|uniref:Cytochrome d ubiquinol oxidase subunit II n=1 Tax=Neobacillus paridis TaxID=2803862 RepID=A0ABS1TRB7_9BACI|nr:MULTISPECIES: cytochrome d ubiquinol oxidase subunit II [Neobacillus]MBL4953817.1 cytochrome d ubiquinol oxidase subunit II [Neobacillus paridis]WML30935.1 cytochrome d ubiquinol oxidase subunit II [Neobacillus sp. OS1-32]
MELSELWFVLIAVVFIGFFFLEGFDFGVGMSTRFVAKNQTERSVMVNTIGPFWDANEVWLLTGGGAIFAAFPHWYATMFSGYYLPLFAALLCLIARGVSFEFRRKIKNERWTNIWDWVIFISSLLPPFLLGVLFTSMLKGMPIQKDMNMQPGFTDFINVYSLWGGVTVTILCFLHGLHFLTLKTDGEIRSRSASLAKKVALAALGALAIFVVLSWIMTDIFTVHLVPELALVVLIVLAYALAYYFVSKKREGLAFTMSGLGLAFTVSAIFVGLFPRVMISSINKAFDLTVYNASSGAYSLKIMTIVAVTILPFVLGYTVWSYYIFRKRVTDKEHLTY